MKLILSMVAGVALLGAAQMAHASSHREAPAISKDPSVDNTDVYAFVSPDNPTTVTLIANYSPAQDPGLGGFNCQTIAIQVPIADLTSDGSVPTDPSAAAAILGVWASANRPETLTLNGDGTQTYSGPVVQYSRLGMPLVNEVVIPLGQKDAFNRSNPVDDGQFLGFVTDPELAGLLNAIYGVSVPPAPRNDLVSVFLTGVAGLNQPANGAACEALRLNVAIPPASWEDPLGVIGGDVAGFPNGRRLGDDVVDIALRVVAGVLVPGFDGPPNSQLGDGVDCNDRAFLSAFPYVGTPHNGYSHSGHELCPSGPVPVRLLSFELEAVDKEVRLDWRTADESAILGFRMERNSASVGPNLIPASSTGSGDYSFTDEVPTRGKYRYTLLEVHRDGTEHVLAQRDIDVRPVAGGLVLSQNAPNPFFGSSTVSFQLGTAGGASLSVFDVQGKVRHQKEWAHLEEGRHDYVIEASEWPSGVYFYRVKTDSGVKTRSMRVVK